MVKFLCYFLALINAKEAFAQADTLLGALKENEAPAPRLLQTSPSAAPTTVKPTTTTPGIPLPCPSRPYVGDTVINPRDVPLASGTYAIASDLLCNLIAYESDYYYWKVAPGSNVVINIAPEGVSIRALIIEVAGGSVKIRGGPITFSAIVPGNQAIGTPFRVYDGGLLTINSDVVYTAQSKRMITSGYVDISGGSARAGGTIVFGGTASFTQNRFSCSSTYSCKGMAVMLEEGASLTFKKKAEFKFNTVFYGYPSFQIAGGAIFVRKSTLVFEGAVVFESNKANRGGALYIDTSTVQFKGSAPFKNNNADSLGGALYNSASTVSFAKTAKFDGNVAGSTSVIPNGGAIYAFVSTTTPAVTKFCVLPTGIDVVDGTKFSCSGCETTIAC